MGMEWQGSWVGQFRPRLNLFACLDAANRWNAVSQFPDGSPFLRFSGTLNTSPTPIITGTCQLVKTFIVDFEVSTDTYSYREVYVGSIINFTSYSLSGPFNLTLISSMGSTISQFEGVSPGSELVWIINETVVDMYELEVGNGEPVRIYMGSHLVGSVYLSAIGTVLRAVESKSLDSSGLVLSIACYSPEDLTIPHYMEEFFPVSGSVDSRCGDLAKLWVGRWSIEVDSWVVSLGAEWYVCQSSSGGLVSSFSDAQEIAILVGTYYISESIEIGFYSLSGEFVRYQDNDRGKFYFTLNQNKTSFTGIVVYKGNSYGAVGTLESATPPYPYLCSPFDMFGGLWTELQYSSWMVLCVNNSFVKGSFFGGAILVSGRIEYSWGMFQNYYVTTSWHLIFETLNTITNETESLFLFMDKSAYSTPITLLNGHIFASPEFRAIPDCNSIPSTWGTYSDNLFSSKMYLCTDTGNTVYGTLNNGNYRFSGVQTDINTISGKILNTDLEFNWILGKTQISAEYKDENGVAVYSLLPKISNEVTYSQCRGYLQISAFIGKWKIGESFLYLCQVFDTEVEGKMDTYHFSGVFRDSMITGTYIKSDLSSGNWTATTNLEEKEIVLTIDNTPSLFGNRSFRTSSSVDCGAWRTFWKTSFGTPDLSHLLGGCFSVCFKSFNTDFSIIFFNTEIHGNGTLNLFTGKLSGYLQNGLNFSISIDSVERVNAYVQDTYGNNVTIAYSPCSSLPSNFSTDAYKNCLPTRFNPTVPLSSNPLSNLLNFKQYNQRKGGIDLTSDGKVAIVASGNATFLMVNSGGTWTIDYQFELPIIPWIGNYYNPDYSLYGGNPVAITDTHAFIINLGELLVFQNISGEWKKIGSIDPPYGSRPYYLTKAVSDGFSVLEVTYKADSYFLLYLYNISNGKADLSPFASITPEGYFLSVTIHSSWLVYSAVTENFQFKVFYCALSLPISCQYMKLASLTSTRILEDVWNFGLGFSLAVNENYLFVGDPASQNNNGSIYVYKFNNYIWRLSQILYPPDTGLHQSFGRTIIVRDNYLMVLKAQDNTLRPLSMALFLYTLSPSGLWVPKYKFVSEDWPAIVSSTYKKRQFFYPSFLSPLESEIYWSVSNNGTLFVTSPSLDSFVQSWFYCADSFWGIDCSLKCPCESNSTCISGILGYYCDCTPNTYGVNCENNCTDCHGAPCDDGSSGSGICLCNSSQYGPECLPCLCLHGNCSSGPSGTGLCTCNEGYTGKECETKITDNTLIISLSVVIPCVVLAFLLTLLYFLCRKQHYHFDISDLPEDLQWYFDFARINSESGWNENDGWMVKNVKEDKKYLQKLKLLIDLLDGVLIPWTTAYAVFNPTLQNNFLGFRNIIQHRHKNSPGIFKKNYQKNERRDWVMEQYNLLVKKYEWNSQLELPILPVVHGTDMKIAKSICSTGFAALSSLDSGFYGKGIYTTPSCLYALPYYALKSKPVILICLITPGNVAPIIEDINDVISWSGKPIPNGFQSHYVITAQNGKIFKDTEEKFFDEFVLPTESQLLPIYLLSVENSAVQELLQEYQREIVESKKQKKFKIV